MAVDLSGKFVYVTNFFGNNISGYAIDPVTGALAAIAGSPFSVEANPYFVAVESSGKFVYVANLFDNNISGYRINSATGALTAVACSPFAGTRPANLAFTRATPSARAVYIINEGSESVSVINPSTNTVVSTVTVGPNPVDAAITPNGASAYVTNAGADTVSVINTASNSLAAKVKVGWRPVDAAVTPDGDSVYVTNAGSALRSQVKRLDCLGDDRLNPPIEQAKRRGRPALPRSKLEVVGCRLKRSTNR